MRIFQWKTESTVAVDGYFSGAVQKKYAERVRVQFKVVYMNVK
jgi:hypothetical protein